MAGGWKQCSYTEVNLILTCTVVPVTIWFDGMPSKQHNSDVNTLRPRQICCHFADDIFKCILLNENVWDSLTISLKFVPTVRINNTPKSSFQGNFRDRWMSYVLRSFLKWMSLVPADNKSVNTGSGNGLVPAPNKPLSEPILAQISVAIWRH